MITRSVQRSASDLGKRSMISDIDAYRRLQLCSVQIRAELALAVTTKPLP